MKQTVQSQRQLRFDEINAIVREITADTEEVLFDELPERERRKRKEMFWDCLMDFLIDGFASGLLFLDKDLALPDPYRFLDITYQDGESVSEKFDKNADDPEALQMMIETEGNRLWNTGFLEAGKGETDLYKTWETMGDFKVRETHDYLEGMTIPFDEEFVTIGGDSALAPGLFESPENNCGCRCWLTYSKHK